MMDADKKEKFWRKWFVHKPVGFVIFLLLGIVIFLYVAIRVRIPVYTSIRTKVEKNDLGTRIDRKKVDVIEGSPIYLYQSREDSMEMVSAYQIDGTYIWIEDGNLEKTISEGEIFLDVQTRQESLLTLIFTNGGENGGIQ